MRSSSRVIVVLLAALLGAGCGSQTDPGGTVEAVESEGLTEPLTVGLIPNVSPEEQEARYEPLAEYLADALGVDVELFVATSYAGVVQAMASDQLDVAYFGGLTYLQAQREVAVEPLVTEVDQMTGTSRYISALIVRDDSGHESLQDVLDAGGTFAMGDIASTSSSYAPRAMLLDAGARCTPEDLGHCPPLESVEFTGGHDSVAHAVLQGQSDAGGLELRILHRLEEEGAVPEGELRVIDEMEVEGYPWVARAAIDAQAREAIAEAFLAIDDPELLDLLRADGYTSVDAADYDQMREEAEQLGLLRAADDAR